jgi:transposase
MYAEIRAVDGGSGRPAVAPEILFTLWLYATLEGGVGSARAIARLTQNHDTYRWICGGLPVNYPTLSDYRGAHGSILAEPLSLMTALLARSCPVAGLPFAITS